MARDIFRIIKLVLDRAAAQRAEAEAKRTLGGIEGALGRVKLAAQAIGKALIAVFAIQKLLTFGRDAVREAAAAEVAWTNLRGTVEATGKSFDAMEADLRALSVAFQDATVHGDDEFAEGLARMISLTGDTDKSLKNMGLAADVAARFFDGELAPAIELISKVMNGQTRAAKLLVGETDSAAEALQRLADRSMGAAADRANTLRGQVDQLKNAWSDFKEAVGNAMRESGYAGGALKTLTAVIKTVTQYVDEFAAVVTWTVLPAIIAWNTALGTLTGVYGGLAKVVSFFAPGLRAHANDILATAENYVRLAKEATIAFATLDPRKFWGAHALPGGPGGARLPTPTDIALPDEGPEKEEKQKTAQELLRERVRLLAEGFDLERLSTAEIEEATNLYARLAAIAGDMNRTLEERVEAAGLMKALEDIITKTDEGKEHLGELVDAFGVGFDRAADDAEGFAAAFAAGIRGGIAEAARTEAGAQIAKGTAKIAEAIWPPNPLAWASAAKHFAAAALFTTLAGAAGPSRAAVASSPQRDVGGAASERMAPPGNEVHIHFVGPGFDITNPEVQRVVVGALQQGTQIQGNAHVRVHRRRR